MSKATFYRNPTLGRFWLRGLVGLLTVFSSAVSTADIIWSGDFNNQDFLNYHQSTDRNKVRFNLVPEYGRPPQYGGQVQVGNGDLLDLVSNPTRGSNFAARFRVKSAANGGLEPRDCDPAIDCETRRSELQMTATLVKYYNAIPYRAERWMSMSFFVPEDFQVSDAGWGPVVWGSKGNVQAGPGWAGLSIKESGWQFIHRYYSENMQANNVDASASYWLTVDYSSTFPNSKNWPQGLVDFPNEDASKAALANLNRGGWTDFVFHFRTDISDYSSGFESRNNGFFDVYMRAGSGPWVHVIAIRPMENLARDSAWVTTNPERVYNRGVGQYGPGGYTSQMGLYMDRDAVWANSKSMVIFMDNVKIGDQSASFESMTHDGSSFSGPARSSGTRPQPPQFIGD